MERYCDDAALFSAFHSGNEQAIQVVYKRHFKPLYFFAQRFTFNKDDAKDLVTDVFIKMIQKKEEFQKISNVKSFLYLSTKMLA